MNMLRSLYISRSKPSCVTRDMVDNRLRKGTEEEKIETLWHIIKEIAMGAEHQDILLTLSMVVPKAKDKRMIVMFYQYMESISMESAPGVLKDEVLMVCNMIRMHLSHPNEHIRSIAIRALGRIKCASLFDSLKEPFIENITYSNSFTRASALIALRSLMRDKETYLIFEEALVVVKMQLLRERDGVCLSEGYKTIEMVSPEMANELYISLRDTTHKGMQECFIRTAARIHELERIQEIVKADRVSKSVSFEGYIYLVRLGRTEEEVKEAVEALLEIADEYIDIESKTKIIREFKRAKRRGIYSFEGLALKTVRMISSTVARVSRETAEEIFEFVMEITRVIEAREVFFYLQQQLLEGEAKEESTLSLGGRVFFLSALRKMAISHKTTSSPLTKSALNMVGSLVPQVAMVALEYLETLFIIEEKDFIIDLIKQLEKIKYGKILRKTFSLISAYGSKESAKYSVSALSHAVDSENESILGSLRKNESSKIFPGVSISQFLMEMAKLAENDEELRKEIVMVSLKICAIGERSLALDQSSRVALIKCAEAVSNTPIKKNKKIQYITNEKKKEKSKFTLPIFSLVKDSSQDAKETKLASFIAKEDSLSLFKIKNIFQLSSLIDPLYIECKVVSNRTEILLDTLVVNQTDVLLENIELDLITSTNIKVLNIPSIETLRPHSAHSFTLSLLLLEADTGYIGGVITAGQMGRDDFFMQNLQEISFALSEMLVKRSIEKEHFKEQWPLLLWENFYTINVPNPTLHLPQIMATVIEAINGTVIESRSYENNQIRKSTGDTPQILVQNIFTTTIKGTDLFINATLQHSPEGASISFRIRGQKCPLVKSLCQLVSKSIKHAL
ncbi:coatomer subunit beta [Nematocida sp. LUAm3]|nr:coatomer subunit beta [Nematocida sp. LUAm3]KAI5174748.1 coatomer subunit beta [Nematocida sp. LUAm2]KAI5177841.1 coatomer subunit beta [Nematocida sp. LUAm1]